MRSALGLYGCSTYNLLCKQSELKMKARKLLNHKLETKTCDTTKDLQIKLIKVEYMTQWPDKFVMTQETLGNLKQYRGQSLDDSTHYHRYHQHLNHCTKRIKHSTTNLILRKCIMPVLKPILIVMIQNYTMLVIVQNYMN